MSETMNSSVSGTLVSSLDPWTTPSNQTVRRFQLVNSSGMSVTVMSWGATLTSVQLPATLTSVQLPGGDDVTLGYDDLAGYLSTDPKNPYIGCVVGRVANRVKESKFQLEGREFQLEPNNGVNSLHGGYVGLDKVNWNAEAGKHEVVFTTFSTDGHGGYPGNLVLSVKVSLTEDNTILLTMKGMADQSTPVNLACHAYFNLAGHQNADAVLDHVVSIPAQFFTPVGATLIPTGEMQNVQGTPFDLREATRLGDVINKVNRDTENPGYDHNWVINTTNEEEKMKLVCHLQHPPTGRSLKVISNQPGLQFYTGNFLPKKGLPGKNDATYRFHGGIVLETQQFPDFVNQETFPDGIVKPGQVYNHVVGYKFGF